MTPAQIEQRRNAGRKGGLVTKAKYGVEYLRVVGRAGGHKGGRPAFWDALQRAREQEDSRRRTRGKGNRPDPGAGRLYLF